MVNMAANQPTTLSELQLYRVLQRGNLLQYYDIFIQQGGDDVQQLCEAGEEEFLEIMALVGMAAKPLHVRRLQKSLHDWMKSPSVFQQPISYLDSTSSSTGLLGTMHAGQYMFPSHHSPVPTWDASPIAAAVPSTSPQRAALSPRPEPPAGDSATNDLDPSETPSPTPLSAQMDFKRSPSPASSAGTERTSYSPGVTANLTESQILAISECAKQLSETLPEFQPKAMNVKKQIGKEIEDLMNITMEDPNRLELMRKYGAIYGRFDSKRKLEKPMSLHEVSVNEASAQLCFYIPALLTRREDLFPLARQVVRDSGYQYAKGHSRAHGAATPTKRPKLEPKMEQMTPNTDIPLERSSVVMAMSKSQRESRIAAISEELNELVERLNSIKEEVATARESADYSSLANLQKELESLMSRQVALVIEQNELKRRGKRGRPRKTPLVITPGPDDLDSSKQGSDCSSHPSEGDFDLSTVKALFLPQPQGQNADMKDIMFDEGLRIAKQFGLQDFAEELMGLKTEVVSNHGNQEDTEEVEGHTEGHMEQYVEDHMEGEGHVMQGQMEGHNVPSNDLDLKNKQIHHSRVHPSDDTHEPIINDPITDYNLSKRSIDNIGLQTNNNGPPHNQLNNYDTQSLDLRVLNDENQDNSTYENGSSNGHNLSELHYNSSIQNARIMTPN